jgi:single-stranded-DNA-specific exonuclease
MAAGFSLQVSNLENFSQKIQAVASTQITLEMLEPSLNIDCQLPAELLTLSAAQELEKLAPFGVGNRTPVFQLSAMELLDWRKLGQAEQHLKLSLLEPVSGKEVVGMAWQRADLVDQCQPGDLVSLAAQLDINSWKGRRSLQLIIKDLQKN